MEKWASLYTSEILGSQSPSADFAAPVGAETMCGGDGNLQLYFMGPKQMQLIQCLKIKIFSIKSESLDSQGENPKI